MQILSKSASARTGGAARSLTSLLTLCIAATLCGCSSGGDLADLKQFVAKAEQRPPGHIEPLPPFEQVAPFAYEASALRSPFEPPVKVHSPNRPSGPQVKPDPNRPKQYLEHYPLAQLTMVGTLSKGNRRFALVKDGDGGVHRVQKGDYMGTDNGKIEQVDEGAIELTEIVPDGAGGWVERARTVPLGGGDKG